MPDVGPLGCSGVTSIAEQYRHFAEHDAAPVSPIFADWARGVSESDTIRAAIDTLPADKRHPTLVFASARWVGCPIDDWSVAGPWFLEHWAEIEPVILARATQTNEAGRCATLLGELSSIHGPIALLEVGTSAGLCLYPDRYSYRYTGRDGVTALDPADGISDVVLPCALVGDTPAPRRLPEIVWRAGIDRSPIDTSDADQLSWLDTLIWPGQGYRRPRLHAAAAIVRSDPPLLVRGDLVDELEATAALAPEGATLVVFHSAVLMYPEPERRRAFVDTVSALDAVWLSNEGANVLPGIAERMPPAVDATGRFVLARDGEPVALTGFHGQSLERIGAPVTGPA